MKNIINKLILYTIGVYTLLTPSISETHLVIVLLVLILSAMIELIGNRFLSLLYLPLFIFFPQSIVLMPLAILDANILCLLTFIPLLLLNLNPVNLILVTLALMIRYYADEAIENHKRYLRSIDYSREEKLHNEHITKMLSQSHEHELINATMQERNRIAHDIHDGVGHQLSSSIIQVGAINLINEQEALKEPLKDLQETLNEAMSAIRNSVHHLHNQSIQLDKEIDAILKRLGAFDITFDYHIEQTPSNPISETLTYIIKEAINNILKHSNANKLTLNISESNEAYHLLIQDNGTSVNKSSAFGMGLNSMNQRIHTMNGIFNLQTENGYRIYASIPKKEQV